MFKKVDPKELDLNVFSAIGDRWMLITAGTPECCNTMTASWGGLGILWNKPMAIAYVRPQRYTKKFMDETMMKSFVQSLARSCILLTLFNKILFNVSYDF